MEKDHLEILLEDIKEKFDLVLEGHSGIHREIKDMRQDMNERFELVDFKVDTLHQRVENVREELVEKIDTVDKKIDAVAEDLAAHRADTEVHGKGYKVSEG